MLVSGALKRTLRLAAARSSIHRDIRLGWVEREWIGAEANGEFGE
jgi:hypothetical protein